MKTFRELLIQADLKELRVGRHADGVFVYDGHSYLRERLTTPKRNSRQYENDENDATAELACRCVNFFTSGGFNAVHALLYASKNGDGATAKALAYDMVDRFLPILDGLVIDTDEERHNRKLKELEGKIKNLESQIDNER